MNATVEQAPTCVRAAYPATLYVRSLRYCGERRDFWNPARRCEVLPNGQWRVDYRGGLVEMFSTMPECEARS